MMTCLEMSEHVLRRAREIEAKRRSRRKTALVLGLAACLVLTLGVGVPLLYRRSPLNQAAQNPESVAAKQELSTRDESKTPDDPLPSDSVAEQSMVSVPPVQLPDRDSAGTAADMIALVVYHGAVYTDAGFFWGEEAEPLQALLGEKLGTAVGSIDEWSTMDSYAEEFASTCDGPIYAVRGYDTGFRLCLCRQVEDQDGTPIWTAQLLERLNGIDLSAGADLLEDRLHLSGRIRSAKYRLHDDWNDARAVDYPLDLDLTDFLAAADGASFVDLWQQNQQIYSVGSQAHLYLSLDDGSTVALRLLEGGYVGYEPLGWYFLQLPPEVFDPVFRACIAS